MIHTLTSAEARRVAGRIAAWLVAGFLLGSLVVGVWVGIRGALAYLHLASIEEGASRAGNQLLSDPSEGVALISRFSADAASARDLTSDPLWHLAEATPWIGPQLSALGVIAASSDDLLTRSLLPLATAAQESSLDALKPVNGRIDPSVFAQMADPAQSAADTARAAATAVDDIDQTPLLGAIQSGVARVDEVFSQAADGLDALSRATRLLPNMLGQDNARKYLVLVQNNAESRSLGGIAGTAILLRADNGAISLEATTSGTALSERLGGRIVELPEEIRALYGDKPGKYFQNLTQIPDFTVDGPLAREMYESITGVTVDGVVTIDPVALSYMLEATGPVALPDGSTLTADNAAHLLLNEVYKKYVDPSEQDAFFAQATGTVFTAFLSGTSSAPRFLTAFSRAVEERRMLIWSAQSEEQAQLTGTTIAGELPATNDDTARFGVYLNEAGGSKMSFYVKPSVTLSWSRCDAAAHRTDRELALRIDVTNTAPADAATSLPTYLTANGLFGVAPGNASTLVNVVLPQGWELVSATESDGGSFASATFEGRQVVSFGTNLAPQTSAQIDIRVRALSAATKAEAFVTPTADSSIDPTPSATCEFSSAQVLQ